MTDEDQVCVLHCTMAQQLSSEDKGVNAIFPTGTACALVPGLQEVLLGAPRHLLQSAQ